MGDKFKPYTKSELLRMVKAGAFRPSQDAAGQKRVDALIARDVERMYRGELPNQQTPTEAGESRKDN